MWCIASPVPRMLAEELTEAHRLDVRVKELTAEIKAAVLARGSHLMDLPGIGPAGAGRILADVGDVARFPFRHHFASWTGTAPIDASTGAHQRHRLSRAGNRRLNHVLHIAATVQMRHHGTLGKAYYDRKRAAGKRPLEAMRCLKRHSQCGMSGRTVLPNQVERAGSEVGHGAG